MNDSPSGDATGRAGSENWVECPPRFHLQAIAAVGVTRKGPIPGAKPPEASPMERLTERQSIRPARTAVAHQRGGNKGK